MKRLIQIVVFMMLVSMLILTACSSVPVKTSSTLVPTSASNTVTNTITPSQTISVGAVTAPSGIKGNAQSVEYLHAVPMTQSITVTKMPVKASKSVLVPIITWGGDVATILANGGSDTKPGTIFANEGLSLKLFREDNFTKAVEKVISGDTPYLRGTMDMITSATEPLQDRGIQMVVIYQMTWSTGGDTIVWKNINNPSDLKGKSIGIQLYGPHMLYVATVLKDAGLSVNDVTVNWMRELTYPAYDSKGIAVDAMSAMQKDNNLSAVTVISPDMLALTSGGSVGTGAEGSVKGAVLGLSTKTAGRVIADVYAVRKDWFDQNRDEVQKFVHGLLLAQEQLSVMYKSKTTDYQDLLKTSAILLRDNVQATGDVDGLLGDCTFVGYTGNVLFFDKDISQKFLRDFPTLVKESQDALKGFGLITKDVVLYQANWDYNLLTQGLKNTSGVVAQQFDSSKVEQYVKQRDQMGVTQSGSLFSFDIFFQPNQNSFTVEAYQSEFDKIISIASTYPGAIVIVEGNADPTSYMMQKQNGIPQQILDQIKQSAKNLSLARAVSVRESVINYAKSKSIIIDPSQFTVVGAGIDKPKYATPKNEQEWRSNMRVSFQIIQIEAEMSNFTPITK